MPKVDVVDLKNQKVGEIELADEVFASEVNQSLLYESVRHYTAGLRRGTAKVKSRHEVSGSGKKLWKQKGTGRARMGSIRSPLWRHGGTAHGPKPKDYSYSLPKKMMVGALRSALTAKLRDGELTVVDAFSLPDHKSKTVRTTLNGFQCDKTVLLVDAVENRSLELGSRNLPGVKMVMSRQVTTYDLLGHKRVLISQEAAKKLSEALSK